MNMIYENIGSDGKIVARTHGEALEKAVEMIAKVRRERGASLDHGYILFVPDKYTLLAEKLLYADGGAFDVEALTLNRLYYRVSDGAAPAGRPLSRVGAVLTVRRILSEMADGLDCYKGSAHTAGFGETVYDNLCQFAASGLSSDDLPEWDGDVTAHKLRDLKKIYAAYEKATEGKYVDSAGRMKLLYELLDDTHIFDDTDVYFACYDGFTPMQAKVVNKICKKAVENGNKAFVIGAKSELNVRVKRLLRCMCRSRADELKTAAVRIKDLVKNYGARYGDIAVIAPSADFNRLSRIFAEYEIPFFTDCKYALSAHPLARYLLDLFAASEHHRNDDYIKLAHNPYSGIDRGDADDFENYISYCALREGAVKSEFNIEPTDATMGKAFKRAESVRKKVATLVNRINRKKIYDGASLCAAIEELLPKDDEEIAKRVDSRITDVREKIIENAALLKEVFSARAEFRVMVEALEEIFALYSVSVLPNSADCVVVGDTSVFRAGGYRYLLVLSMHEGELPATMHDDGMLSDADLKTIAEHDAAAKIEPKIEERNARAIAELYSVLSYAKEEIYVSWCDGCAPSAAMSKLVSEAKKANKEVVEFSRDAMLYKLYDGDEVSADLLTKLCPTEAAARELYLLGVAEHASGGKAFPYEGKLRGALRKQNGDRELSEYKKRAVEAKNARSLYDEHGISVSRVQEYFACPFRGYARYALRLKPRPTGEVTPLDLGDFLHKVMEHYFKMSSGGDYSDAEGKVRRAFDDLLRENPQALKGVGDGFISDLVDEAVRACKAAGEHIVKGNFTPAFIEGEFGEDDGEALRSYVIKLADGGEVTLEGKIDRLDITGNGGDVKGCARIIDYKTGKAEFVLSDIYYGRKVQLPIYLKVAKLNGYTPVGMFYFPFSSDFETDESSYKLLGMFDKAYAYEMDNGLRNPSYKSTVVKAKTTAKSNESQITLDSRGCDGVESETLKGVCDYAEKVFGSGAGEMLGGYCEPSPLSYGQRSECDYCEVRAFCTAYGAEKRERSRTSVKADFIVECARREEEAESESKD